MTSSPPHFPSLSADVALGCVFLIVYNGVILVLGLKTGSLPKRFYVFARAWYCLYFVLTGPVPACNPSVWAALRCWMTGTKGAAGHAGLLPVGWPPAGIILPRLTSAKIIWSVGGTDKIMRRLHYIEYHLNTIGVGIST